MFNVFNYVFSFLFIYKAMEVVPPAGMLVYTAVYTLLTVLFVIHPRRTDVSFNVG